MKQFFLRVWRLFRCFGRHDFECVEVNRPWFKCRRCGHEEGL